MPRKNENKILFGRKMMMNGNIRMIVLFSQMWQLASCSNKKNRHLSVAVSISFEAISCLAFSTSQFANFNCQCINRIKKN
jgi:hypothetical protein